MDVLLFLLILAIALAVAYVVSAPLRRSGGVGPPHAGEPRPGPRDTLRRDDLEAARDAKYRELRDAELDYRTGKLSQDDYERLDAELRAEAMEILESLDDLDEGEAT